MTPFPKSTCYNLPHILLLATSPSVRRGRVLVEVILGANRHFCAAPTAGSGASRHDPNQDKQSSHPVRLSPAEQPGSALRRLLDGLPPGHPSPSTLRNVRRWLEAYGLADAEGEPLDPPGFRSGAASPASHDAAVILASVASLLQPTGGPSAADRYWARASLPELLLLLSRLHIPSHPKLEVALILQLRRGRLPQPSPMVVEPAAPPAAAIGDGTGRRRRGGGGSAAATAPAAGQIAAATPLPPLPPLPTAFRLATAMAALPVRSHEAWQQLADRHILSRPVQLLDQLSEDQVTLLAAAFARAGYHPVALFRCVAGRLLPAVPRLQPGSLARALHAFATLHHHDPFLMAAMCQEAQARLRCGGAGGADGAAGSTSARSVGGGGGGGSLLSRAGAALFGGSPEGRPDRAHRAPQFLLEDLAKLAAAAVQLEAGEAAAVAMRGYGSGGGGGGDGVNGGGDRLLVAVAEEAEEAVAARVRIVAERLRTHPPGPPPPTSSPSPSPFAGAGADAGAAAGTAASASVLAGGPRPVPSWHLGGDEDSVSGLGLGRADQSEASGDLHAADEDAGEGSSATAWEGVSSGGCSSGSSSSSWIADQLEPVLVLLEALVASGAGQGGSGAGGAASAAALAIAERHLVPELPSLEPYLSSQHLLALLAALLPGPGAAALRRTQHPYPGPPPPPRTPLPPPATAGSASGSSAAAGSATRLAATSSGGNERQRSGAPLELGGPGDQLLAVVSALCRRTDTRVFRDGQQLLEAWHVLAAACAAGAAGAADPRVIGELMGPVCEFVVRHVTMLGRPPEAARFFVSCALLSVYDKAALGAMAAPLVATMGGNGGGGGGGGAGPRGPSLSPSALAQLAWAVGHLGYDNEDLLAAIQAEALARSGPFIYRDSSGWGRTDGHLPDGRSGATTSASAASGSSPGAAALLGPLELADVMWGLAVNQFRSNQGADIRELYLRAASQGVVSIDDPRWLRLAQVHLLLLLGWAGGLGEVAAGQLRSGWFNALGYAWERQAVARGEQLAGPTGQPPDPDSGTSAFRQGVAAAARDLIRAGIPANSDDGSGGSGGSGGSWRLQKHYTWGMLQPSADIRLTVPLLLRKSAGMFSMGLTSGSSSNGSGGGSSSGEWVVALDQVRWADEATVGATPPSTPRRRPPGQSGHPAAAGMAPTASSSPGDQTGLKEQPDGGGQQQPQQQREEQQPQEQGEEQQHQQPRSQPQQPAGVQGQGGHRLLGPARWRQLVLRRLGAVVRPIRQEDWERADSAGRRGMLLRVLRL